MVGINRGVGLKNQLLKNIFKAIKKFHSEHKDVTNCSYSSNGCFNSLYINFEYSSRYSFLAKFKLKGEFELDLDDLIVPESEKSSFMSALIADLESSSKFNKGERFFYQCDVTNLANSSSFFLKYVTLPKSYIKLIDWLSSRSTETIPICSLRVVELFGKRGRYNPVVDSTVLVAERKSDDYFKEILSTIKSKYKSGDELCVDLNSYDEGNLEESIENETEYYGHRRTYCRVSIKTPKTGKLKLNYTF